MNRVRGSDVISWAGKNTVNGLVYGNGGINVGPRCCKQNAYTRSGNPPTDKRAQVDFCWNILLCANEQHLL